jgi:hypothetical protein
MKNTYYNFEIYTLHPETGESGWDIEFLNVRANTKTEARELLAKYPLFDCIILFNHRHELESNELFIKD